MYRRDYTNAGLKMLSTVDPSGHRVGAQAMIAALVLVPVSLVPCLALPGAGMILAWALALSIGQLACAVWFFMEKSERAARRLLLASLVYLPAMLGLLALAPWA
jgi:protoheme IX farnesyltransferase